jgi:hypothetical protein
MEKVSSELTGWKVYELRVASCLPAEASAKEGRLMASFLMRNRERGKYQIMVFVLFLALAIVRNECGHFFST